MALAAEKKTATGQDLQSFLRFLEENHPDEIIHVSKEVDPVFEATAALWRLENERRFPAVVFDNIKGSDIPCVTNVHASFPRLAMAIGLPIDATPRDFVLEYMRREENPIPPRLVSNDEAPCKEVILTGDDVDLTIFPSLKYHELDSGQVDPGFEPWQGRYWTLAYETMKDPDTDVPNVGIYRLQVKSKNKVGIQISETAHGHYIMPYRDGSEMVYDSGDYPAQLEQALEAFGYDELRARQADWRAEGRYVGVGISSYVEGSGFGPYEGAIVRLDQRGNVHVVTGAKPHGQGLETTLAQVCADEFGLPPDRITVTSGDTSMLPFGIGTFASRSAVTAGSAVGVASGRLRDKVLTVAGELLEASAADLEIVEDGVASRDVPDQSITFAEIHAAASPGPKSRMPAGLEPGLAVEYYFVPPTVTFASGTHVASVEVDRETGFVRVLRYLTVDDCGRMLNPMIVEGQIQGGVAHGIGSALYESVLYDEECQLLTGSYMPTTIRPNPELS